jgi:hypothetical protein
MKHIKNSLFTYKMIHTILCIRVAQRTYLAAVLFVIHAILLRDLGPLTFVAPLIGLHVLCLRVNAHHLHVLRKRPLFTHAPPLLSVQHIVREYHLRSGFRVA